MTRWTEASLHDLLGVCFGGRHVRLRRPSKFSPVVPVVSDDTLLRSLAELLLARDIVGKLEATSEWDHTPQRNGVYAHLAYGITQPGQGYSIESALDQLEAGLSLEADDRLRSRASIAIPATTSRLRGPWMSTALAPRGPISACWPPRGRIPYTTSSATKALAARIAAFFWSQNEADEAIDVELAEQVADHYTSTRAALLARANLQVPGVFA